MSSEKIQGKADYALYYHQTETQTETKIKAKTETEIKIKTKTKAKLAVVIEAKISANAEHAIAQVSFMGDYWWGKFFLDLMDT